MNTIKRLFALILALGLVCGCALAEDIINKDGSYPVVTSPYKVSVGFVAQGDGIDLSQYYFTAYIDYLSGLDIEWTCIDNSARGERVPLMLNTGDMPDAMINIGLSTSQIIRYGMQEGLFYPVNDLLQYMPVFQSILADNPTVLADITCLDGNIYGFPSIALVDNGFNIRFWYNTEWLANLGLEIPRTLDEFYDTLVAFRDQDADGDGDPSNEIPFSGSWDESYTERAPIMTAMGFNSWGDYMGLNFLPGDPVAAYFPYTDQYKDYLEFMKKLFDEGLLDPDVFTQSEIQYNAKTMEGRVGFGSGASNYVMNSENVELYKGYIPMSSSVYGTPLYTKSASSINNISMVINADVSEEKAIVLAKLADALMDNRTACECILGVDLGSELDFFGWGLTYDEETHTKSYSNKPGDVDDWTFICRYLSPYSLPGYSTQQENAIPYYQSHPETVLGRRYADNGYKYEDWNLDFQGKCLEYVTYVLPSMYMESADMDRLAELKTDLDDYAAKREAQFITGAISLDEYDAFRAELENLGVKEYVEIYNKYWIPYYESLTK